MPQHFAFTLTLRTDTFGDLCDMLRYADDVGCEVRCRGTFLNPDGLYDETYAVKLPQELTVQRFIEDTQKIFAQVTWYEIGKDEFVSYFSYTSLEDSEWISTPIQISTVALNEHLIENKDKVWTPIDILNIRPDIMKRLERHGFTYVEDLIDMWQRAPKSDEKTSEDKIYVTEHGRKTMLFILGHDQQMYDDLSAHLREQGYMD